MPLIKGIATVREAADQTIRREMEGFAHVIFAGSPAQQRNASSGSAKGISVAMKSVPCLHGSDAHMLDDGASPFGDRFSWIKGRAGVRFSAADAHSSGRTRACRRRAGKIR
jgi:hypothetical protein